MQSLQQLPGAIALLTLCVVATHAVPLRTVAVALLQEVTPVGTHVGVRYEAQSDSGVVILGMCHIDNTTCTAIYVTQADEDSGMLVEKTLQDVTQEYQMKLLGKSYGNFERRSKNTFLLHRREENLVEVWLEGHPEAVSLLIVPPAYSMMSVMASRGALVSVPQETPRRDGIKLVVGEQITLEITAQAEDAKVYVGLCGLTACSVVRVEGVSQAKGMAYTAISTVRDPAPNVTHPGTIQEQAGVKGFHEGLTQRYVVYRRTAEIMIVYWKPDPLKVVQVLGTFDRDTLQYVAADGRVITEESGVTDHPITTEATVDTTTSGAKMTTDIATTEYSTSFFTTDSETSSTINTTLEVSTPAETLGSDSTTINTISTESQSWSSKLTMATEGKDTVTSTVEELIITSETFGSTSPLPNNWTKYATDDYSDETTITEISTSMPLDEKSTPTKNTNTYMTTEYKTTSSTESLSIATGTAAADHSTTSDEKDYTSWTSIAFSMFSTEESTATETFTSNTGMTSEDTPISVSNSPSTYATSQEETEVASSTVGELVSTSDNGKTTSATFVSSTETLPDGLSQESDIPTSTESIPTDDVSTTKQQSTVDASSATTENIGSSPASASYSTDVTSGLSSEVPTIAKSTGDPTTTSYPTTSTGDIVYTMRTTPDTSILSTEGDVSPGTQTTLTRETSTSSSDSLPTNSTSAVETSYPATPTGEEVISTSEKAGESSVSEFMTESIQSTSATAGSWSEETTILLSTSEPSQTDDIHENTGETGAASLTTIESNYTLPDSLSTVQLTSAESGVTSSTVREWISTSEDLETTRAIPKTSTDSLTASPTEETTETHESTSTISSDTSYNASGSSSPPLYHSTTADSTESYHWTTPDLAHNSTDPSMTSQSDSNFSDIPSEETTAPQPASSAYQTDVTSSVEEDWLSTSSEVETTTITSSDSSGYVTDISSDEATFATSRTSMNDNSTPDNTSVTGVTSSDLGKTTESVDTSATGSWSEQTQFAESSYASSSTGEQSTTTDETGEAFRTTTGNSRYTTEDSTATETLPSNTDEPSEDTSVSVSNFPSTYATSQEETEVASSTVGELVSTSDNGKTTSATFVSSTETLPDGPSQGTDIPTSTESIPSGDKSTTKHQSTVDASSPTTENIGSSPASASYTTDAMSGLSSEVPTIAKSTGDPTTANYRTSSTGEIVYTTRTTPGTSTKTSTILTTPKSSTAGLISSTSPSTSTAPSRFKCPVFDPNKPYLYPHPYDCHKFFSCPFNVKYGYEMDCPSGLGFDVTSHVCVRLSNCK